MRTEKDSMGTIEVPDDAYWGARSCGAARWCGPWAS